MTGRERKEGTTLETTPSLAERYSHIAIQSVPLSECI